MQGSVSYPSGRPSSFRVGAGKGLSEALSLFPPPAFAVDPS